MYISVYMYIRFRTDLLIRLLIIAIHHTHALRNRGASPLVGVVMKSATKSIVLVVSIV